MVSENAKQGVEQTPLTFQEIILRLQRYWADLGCVILQPYDNEVGAGTFHTATTLRSLGPDTWKTAYVQPCRRPTDGRYGETPTVCSIIISSRFCLSLRPITCRICTLIPFEPLVLKLKSMMFALLKTLGKSNAGRLGLRLGSVA